MGDGCFRVALGLYGFGDFYPALTAHPHNKQRLRIVLVVHLGVRAGASYTREALELAAFKVHLSVAAAVVLQLLRG